MKLLEPVVCCEMALPHRLFLVLTNLLYFVPILVKCNAFGVLVAFLGVVSLVFHGAQCSCTPVTGRSCLRRAKVLCTVDVAAAWVTFAAVVVLHFGRIPGWWYPLWGFPLALFVLGDGRWGLPAYSFLHGGWHLLSGVLFCVLAFRLPAFS